MYFQIKKKFRKYSVVFWVLSKKKVFGGPFRRKKVKCKQINHKFIDYNTILCEVNNTIDGKQTTDQGKLTEGHKIYKLVSVRYSYSK